MEVVIKEGCKTLPCPKTSSKAFRVGKILRARLAYKSSQGLGGIVGGGK